MLPPFSTLRPKSKEETLRCLAGGEDSAVLAGGTDILVRMKKGESHRRLVDITGIHECSGVAVKESRLVIGATTSPASLSAHALIRASAPALAEAASQIGSPQIRNMATIGGNLVNASPAADSIPPLLLHDAEVTLESSNRTRTEKLERFITGPYRTGIDAAEILTSINLQPLAGYREGYRRIAKRAAWAISRLGIAWAIAEEEDRFTDVRIAIGSCTPAPLRARKVEAFLVGKKKDAAIIREAAALCLTEIRAISGERPSFAYKLPVIRDLLLQILGGA